MRGYDKLWQQAWRATGSEKDWEPFYEQMDSLASVIELHINCFGNRARFLRLVTEVLNGKTLRGAPHDDVILRAVKIAIEKAKKRRRKNRKIGRGLDVSDLCPPFSEIDNAYEDLTTPSERRDERQVRRRLKALGQGTSLGKDRPGHATK